MATLRRALVVPIVVGLGFVALVVGGFALTACCDDAEVVAAGPIEHPTGASDVVVRVATGGGFVPVDTALASVPELTLYGDGRLVLLGPQIEIFPPPALPPLQETHLGEAEIGALLARAEAAGLLDDPQPDYGLPQVTDLPATTVTVAARGTEHTVSAYALGFEDPALTADQRAAREELSEFITAAFAAAGDDVDDYQPDALVVYVLDDVPTIGDEELDQPPLDWPLEPLADAPAANPAVGCILVDGSDATTVLTRARNANTLTPWRSGGDEYFLVFRPLLPDESGCDDRL